MKGSQDQRFERLRELAEPIAGKRSPSPEAIQAEDIPTLINEIQVYHAELEIQNEELRRSQNELQRSRDRFSMLFNMAPAGYLVLDEAGIIADANRTILKLLQVEHRDLIGKPFAPFITPEDRPVFLGRLRAFYKNPASKVLEVRLSRKGGQAFHARLEGCVIPVFEAPADREAFQFCLMVTDVSEGKAAESALRKSEAEYRSLVTALNDAVVSADLDGRITFMNACAERLFGCPSRAALGSPLERFCPDDLRAEQREMIRQVRRHGSIPPTATERISVDGRRMPVEITISLRSDERGEPIGFNGVIRDITERRRLDAALRRAERQLRLVVDSVPAQIWQKDRNGVFLQANRAYCNALGRTEAQILGKTDAELFSPEIAAQNTAADRRVLASGTPEYGLEERFEKASGEFGWSRKDKLPYHDDDGRIAGTIGLAVDITTIKETERHLRDSEHRFRSFVESANDIVYSIDPDGRFTYVSPNWIDFMGEPAGAAVGRPFEPYVHPEDVHLCREFLHRVLATGRKQSSVEYRVRHRDGSWRWHYSNGAPLMDDDGNVTGYLGIGRDITGRKQAEAAMAESERYLRTILRTTADGFWEIDRGKRLVEVNDAYCAMSGYSRGELIGMRISNLEADETPAETAVRFQRILAAGSEIFETRHRRKDGSVFPLEVSVTWLESKGGRMVCFCRDLTERKAVEDKILHLQKAESLGRMAGAIAHHYNNLLAVVTGNLELGMEDCAAAGAPLSELREAMTAARRAVDLGGRMLAYLGKTPVRNEQLDLSAVCRRLLPELRAEWPPQVALESHFPDPGPVVLMNVQQFRQVLDDLLRNSREALDGERGRVVVTLRTVFPRDVPAAHRWPVEFQTETAAYACLEVADTGCGIVEEAMAKLFDPFYSTKFTGRGLGLSVVLGTVKAWGGCVAVESAPGEGSLFRVFLPATRVPPS